MTSKTWDEVRMWNQWGYIVNKKLVYRALVWSNWALAYCAWKKKKKKKKNTTHTRL